MDNKIKAPFTDAQVDNIIKYQKTTSGHPFTCCGYNDCTRDESNNYGVLEVYNEKLVCPCGKYSQDWVHSFMAEEQPLCFTIDKNCNNCTKQLVCKFRDDYKALVSNNKFFMMFGYDTNNNLLQIFEANASRCKHYESSLPVGKISKEQFNKLSFNIQAVIINEYFKYLKTKDEGFILVKINDTVNLNINDVRVFDSSKDELNIEIALNDGLPQFKNTIHLNSKYSIVLNNENVVYNY